MHDPGPDPEPDSTTTVPDAHLEANATTSLVEQTSRMREGRTSCEATERTMPMIAEKVMARLAIARARRMFRRTAFLSTARRPRD